MCGGGGREVKAEKILGKGKKLWERSTTEAEKEENIWRREIFFTEEEKNGDRRGGKYLDKESIVLLKENILRVIFFRGEEKRKRKRGEVFGEGTFLGERNFWEEKENEKSTWGRNCFLLPFITVFDILGICHEND